MLKNQMSVEQNPPNCKSAVRMKLKVLKVAKRKKIHRAKVTNLQFVGHKAGPSHSMSNKITYYMRLSA